MDQALKKNGPQSLGKNVAGFGTKIHLIMNQQGVVAVKPTGAQVRDSKLAQERLRTLKLNTIQDFVADKAYDFKALRELLKERCKNYSPIIIQNIGINKDYLKNRYAVWCKKIGIATIR